MTRLLSLPEWAKAVGMDRSNANRLANAGRIPGAVKVGRNWAVPEGTPKPAPLPMGTAAHKGRGDG